MNKKILLIISLVLIFLLSRIIYNHFFIEKNYTIAQKKCELFLNSNIDELTAIAQECLENESSSNKSFKGISSISYEPGVITFDMDSKGFLGDQCDQYW